MFQKSAPVFAAALTALTLAACSSGTIKPEKLRAVKKAAVIGLDLEQQKAVSGTDLFKIATHQQVTTGQPNHGAAAEAAYLEGIHQDVSAAIGKKTGWKMKSLAEIRATPSYAKLFKEKTEGWQMTGATHERYDLLRAPGLLDMFPLMTTEADRLKAVARDLGVDALVVVKSTINLNNSGVLSSLVGKGEYKPSSNIQMFVIEGLSGEKILVRSMEGPKVEKSVRNVVGMSDQDQLNEKAREATALAMTETLKDLKY